MSAHPSELPTTPSALAERYRIEAELGRGSQGRTWRATRLSDGLPVAIKALHLANVDNWKAVELFEREARALQAIDGVDGVPRLIEYLADQPNAEHADPVFYLVQELVDGTSLAARMARGERFVEAEVLDIARGVLHILDALHRRNPPLIHRDIKPGNILLRADGGVSLVDFGAVSDAISSTAEGSTVAGTLGYMAPEQFQGRALPASDLYGLGATLVHLLSGVAPSAMETRVFKLDFVPHVGHVRPSLVAVLHRLLDPDHEARLASARAALDALDSLDAPALHRADEEEEEDALAVASKLDELQAVGQPGHLALFHAMGPTPRPFPWSYRRKIMGRYVLYLGGGFVVAVLSALGALTFLGFGGPEAAMFMLVPFFFGYWLHRGSKRYTELVRHGTPVLAEVTHVQGRSDGEDVHYVFRLGEHVYSGRTRISHAEVLLEPGSKVGVVYKPDDPELSVIHPLPARAIVGTLMQDEDE